MRIVKEEAARNHELTIYERMMGVIFLERMVGCKAGDLKECMLY